MVLEGIVTTLDAGESASMDDADGDAIRQVNIAPMGPLVTATMETLILRPYRTSRTYRNLRRHGEGVFHVTDDVELLARAAVGNVRAPLRPAHDVRGYRLEDACRAYEFRVDRIDDSDDRTTIIAGVVRCECLRDFFGFHRARHAVVEAAILATRVEILPLDDTDAALDRLEPLVEKPGGEAERRAFDFLRAHVHRSRRKSSRRSDTPR